MVGGPSPHTIHGHVRALRAFATWLHEEQFTKTNLFARLKRPKLPQPMIEILSDQEIANIFAAINPTCLLGARLYVMVLLLLDTGIRASELHSLTLDNTFTKEDYVKVKGKGGGNKRMVPFGATTKKVILRYIHTFRPEPLHNEMRLTR
jgi:site-specific recombinase XerD